MGSVFRKTYTAPIPDGAEHFTITKKDKEIPAVRFKGDDGKTVTAPVVQSGDNAGKRYRLQSPKWYGTVAGRHVPLCTNKAAAETMLRRLISEAEEEEAR